MVAETTARNCILHLSANAGKIDDNADGIGNYSRILNGFFREDVFGIIGVYETA